jgi:hypothetical protein
MQLIYEFGLFGPVTLYWRQPIRPGATKVLRHDEILSPGESR